MNKELNKLGVICDIPLSQLVNNEGQIDGVPKNPRYIKEDEYNALKQSLTASPELLEYKPLMVYKQGEASYVTICGNMRLRAISELAQQGAIALDAVRCFVLHDTTPVEKIKEYAIKDNVQLGNWDWDELANNSWELDELQEWGLNCAFLAEDSTDFTLDETALDGIEQGGFQKALRESTGGFSFTLILPLEHRQQIESYVKQNGKAHIVDMVVELCCNVTGVETEALDEDATDTNQ